MFEALVTLCLDAAANAACREALLPGYAAAPLADCSAALTARPPDMAGAAPADCVPRRAARLAFTEIAPGVFAHRGAVAEPGPDNLGDVSNIAFVIGAAAVAVIDTGGSRAIGEEVYLAIRERSDLPIAAVILTHMHPDHVFGATTLAEAGAAVIGRAGLSRALADRADAYSENFAALIGPAGFLGSAIPALTREVTDEEVIDLGGRSLRLRAWPTAHTASDLTVNDSATGVLFTGDLVFADHAPALDGSLRGWQAVLATMQAEPATLIVPGHGGPALPWPEGGAALAQYLDTLATDTRAALDAGVPLSAASRTIGRAEAPNWLLFDLYNARNATVAYTELEWE
ncbi:MAG: MBL fold metallo-hydrolase [Rhodobacterales bacterium 32-67-9]|nr:MAG: MBL fold metallo-hydrolase [Rhodobacterales bacterium 32-67-9]